MHYFNETKSMHTSTKILSRITAIILSALIISLLTSCGSSSDSASGGSAGAQTAKNYATSGTADSMSASDVSESGDQGTVSYGRKLTKELSVTAETDDFSGTDALLRSETEKAGGYIESSSMNTYNGSKTEQFVIRIPADQLDSFESIISDSCTVTDKSENVEDITDTYNETESELESLRQEMDSLNAMLTKAETVTDTIAIQDRISDVRSRIGTLEAQMKTYDAQISYSRVSVYLSEDSIAKTDSQTVGERISHGFRSTIKLLGDFFVALFVFVISASPILAILAAIIVLILCLSRRSARKKKKPYQDRPGVPDYIDTCGSSKNDTNAENRKDK